MLVKKKKKSKTNTCGYEFWPFCILWISDLTSTNLQFLKRKVKVAKQIYKVITTIKYNSILKVVSMERIIESCY